MRRVRFFLCMAALCMAARLSGQQPSRPVVREVSRAPLGQTGTEDDGFDWEKYCGNLAMTGIATDPRFNPETVKSLALLWSRPLQGPIASQPSVSRGWVFVGDWSGTEYELRAADGYLLATAYLGVTDAPQCNPAHLGITSSAAVSLDAIYLAGGDNAFYALDRADLAVTWRVPLGDNSAAGGYYGWCSPSLVDGLVLQGVSSNCDNPFPPGHLVALDASTGAVLADRVLVGPGEVGAGAWTSPAVDAATSEVFVTTASAPDLDDGLAYSVVRLSLADLAVEDFWKLNPVTTEDADWGSSPTLFLDASGRRLVGAGQKDGNYYAFDRGHLSQGPVWKAPVARGGACPQCGDGTLSTAAFDGERLYVGAGSLPGGAGVGGSVWALDPATGDALWRFPVPGGPVIAPITVVNGVVFAAGASTVYALSADTGALLWSYQANSGFYGGVAIGAGKIFVGALDGTLYAFGFPDESAAAASCAPGAGRPCPATDGSGP